MYIVFMIGCLPSIDLDLLLKTSELRYKKIIDGEEDTSNVSECCKTSDCK